MFKKPPCGPNCARRAVGCQGKCPEYTDWKADRDATKSAIIAEKRTQQRLNGFQIDAYHKTTRKRRTQR